MQKIKTQFSGFAESILNSYSQVFFSKNILFAFIILLVSFFDLRAGISGLLSVMISNLLAYLIGFNRDFIKSGYYGFNSLLVGLGMGSYYQLNAEFLFLLVFAAILTLFTTIVLEGVIGKYGLPYLSVPFLLCIWLVTLASRHYRTLELSESGIYLMNEMYSYGGLKLVNIYIWFANIPVPVSLIIYFKSLGAIFFQYHLFAGIIISAGLLIYSRIGFMLSLIGFFTAYYFYQFIGGNIHELSYSYIGYNFILTSIALGGIFILPSKHSFLWVVLLVPVISVLITGSIGIFNIFQLSIFSLPFNIIVLMFLYIMKFRVFNISKPEYVLFQQFSPEKNLYIQLNNKERFSSSVFFHVALPFWGEWTVTQAHDGDITHKGDWRHALDFQLKSDENITYRQPGTKNEDFFCYNKPVLAPANGVIELIVDNIDDNIIGDVNTENNWGNTVIIRHTEHLYSKLCHLKKGSFKVVSGAYVTKGDHIASCGNSGRSPEPHLHFQLQATPYIGSKTISYPIAHYIKINGNKFELKNFSIPAKNDNIENIQKNTLLFDAFHFIPGQIIKFSINELRNPKSEIRTVAWEIITDIFNKSYILCKSTGSKAWFTNSGNIHYFTHFEGDRSSLLYYFYLAAYKILLGFYKDLIIKDKFPLDIIKLSNYQTIKFIQDFIAPFYLFINANYTCQYTFIDDVLNTSILKINSKAEVNLSRFTVRRINFDLIINENGINSFSINENNKSIIATRI